MLQGIIAAGIISFNTFLQYFSFYYFLKALGKYFVES